MPKQFSREIPENIPVDHLKFLDDMFVNQERNSGDFALRAPQLLREEFSITEGASLAICYKTAGFWLDNFSRGMW